MITTVESTVPYFRFVYQLSHLTVEEFDVVIGQLASAVGGMVVGAPDEEATKIAAAGKFLFAVSGEAAQRSIVFEVFHQGSGYSDEQVNVTRVYLDGVVIHGVQVSSPVDFQAEIISITNFRHEF